MNDDYGLLWITITLSNIYIYTYMSSLIVDNIQYSYISSKKRYIALLHIQYFKYPVLLHIQYYCRSYPVLLTGWWF